MSAFQKNEWGKIGMKYRLVVATLLSLFVHAALLGVAGGKKTMLTGDTRAIVVDVRPYDLPHEGAPGKVTTGVSEKPSPRTSAKPAAAKMKSGESCRGGGNMKKPRRPPSSPSKSRPPVNGEIGKKKPSVDVPPPAPVLKNTMADNTAPKTSLPEGGAATCPGEEGIPPKTTPPGSEKAPSSKVVQGTGVEQGGAEPAQKGSSKEIPAIGTLPGIPAGNLPSHYPRIARRKGWEGTVLLRVRVGKDGLVRKAWVERSSGHFILDQAAMDAALKWRLVKEGPSGRSQFDFRIPVTFRLTRG